MMLLEVINKLTFEHVAVVGLELDLSAKKPVQADGNVVSSKNCLAISAQNTDTFKSLFDFFAASAAGGEADLIVINRLDLLLRRGECLAFNSVEREKCSLLMTIKDNNMVVTIADVPDEEQSNWSIPNSVHAMLMIQAIESGLITK